MAELIAIVLQAFVSYMTAQGEDVTPEEIAERAKKYAGQDLQTLTGLAAEHLKHFQAGSSGSSGPSGSSGSTPTP